MGWPVVLVDSGGLPVTEAINGAGMPVSVAVNGFGIAVSVVDSSGLPVVGLAQFYADGEATPSGFHWEFVTDDSDGSLITDDVTGEPITNLVAD